LLLALSAALASDYGYALESMDTNPQSALEIGGATG
jgi:hypothetical protein